MTEVHSVLQVNTTDIAGGAARVVDGLHHEYLGRGIDSSVAVGFKHGTDERVVEIPNLDRGAWANVFISLAEKAGGPGRARWVAERILRMKAEPLRYADILRGVEDMDYPGTARLLSMAAVTPDVLHLHNLHGYYFDLRRLPELTARVPSVITMHDAWLLTGHCAHPFDCPGWRTGCGSCPDLELYVPIARDATATNRRMKRDVLARSRFALASPSRWLLSMAEESGIAELATSARVIPNGVDPMVFSAGDRVEARRRLRLPLDRPLVLAGAHGLETNPFKDFPTLAEAMGRVATSRRDVTLVALGTDDLRVPGVDVISVPFVEDAEKVADHYRAADVYVHAARAENFPMAILEAMACGTPVAASAVGGIPEIVSDGETGLLVTPRDPAALASAIQYLLEDGDLRASLARSALLRVRDRFTLQRQADSYLEWYGELLEERTGER